LPGEEPLEAVSDLLHRLMASRAKHFALSRDPDADRVAALAATGDLTSLREQAAAARIAEHHARLHIGADPDALQRSTERARHTAHHSAVGQQVKAHDRQNIGTITALDDDHGTVTVRFVAVDGASATRRLGWGDVEILDRDTPPRLLPPAAQSRLGHLESTCLQAMATWRRLLGARGFEPGDAGRFERAAQQVVDREAHRLTADHAPWLTELLGHRPPTVGAAALWDEAVALVAEHRLRHTIPARVEGLAPLEVADPRGATSRELDESLRSTRTAIDHVTQVEGAAPQRVRTTEERAERANELEAILATAPRDQRAAIERLLAAGNLSSVEAVDTLRGLVEAQGARREWILTHWPHVVEREQLERAAQSARPDRGLTRSGP
jgi:hypothetical protein